MKSPENIEYQLTPQVVATDVSGETVILDYEAGKYFGLEGVGSFIWSEIKKSGSSSLKSLCESVVREYDVDEARCFADVKALLENLEKNGLIQAVS